MSSPLVSIVIPVYNEQKYLGKCLESLKNQSYKNKEIIIVDDGSTDLSRAIAKKYNVVLLLQNHEGPGKARNKGVKKAKGEIIVFVDADMSFEKDFIEMLTKPIRDGKAIGTFNTEERVGNSNNIWSICWSANSGFSRNERIPSDINEARKIFRAIKKDIFIKIGGFSVGVGYHDDWSLHEKSGFTAYPVRDAINYHYNPSSLGEIFESARWIGRSEKIKPDIVNLLRYSFINSLRVSTKLILTNKAPIYFYIFKLVYDAGMFYGIFFRGGKTSK